MRGANIFSDHDLTVVMDFTEFLFHCELAEFGLNVAERTPVENQGGGCGLFHITA